MPLTIDPEMLAEQAALMESKGQLPIAKGAPKHSPFVTAMILGGNAMDGATSAYGLAHGAREAYPFMPQSPLANALMKAAVAAGELYGARGLESQGHSKAAKVLATILGGLAGGAGVSNLHQISKLKD